MVEIKVRVVESRDLKIRSKLSEWIQGFIYSCLPSEAHDGLISPQTGKRYKEMTFKYETLNDELTICFVSVRPEYERAVALRAISGDIRIGNIEIAETSVCKHNQETTENEVVVMGHVVSTVPGVLQSKVCIQPQDARHLEQTKQMILDKYLTLTGHPYEGKFEIDLVVQLKEIPERFRYRNGKREAWLAKWRLRGNLDILNMVLKSGMGADNMSYGTGLLTITKDIHADTEAA